MVVNFGYSSTIGEKTLIIYVRSCSLLRFSSVHEDSDSKNEHPHHFVPSSISVIPPTIDFGNDEGDTHDDDNDDDDADMPRLITWYPTDTPSTTFSTIIMLQNSTLQLKEGNDSPQVEIVTEEDPADPPNTKESLHDNVTKENFITTTTITTTKKSRV